MNKETKEIIGGSVFIERAIETASYNKKDDIVRTQPQGQVIVVASSSTSEGIALKETIVGTQSKSIAKEIKKKRKPIVRIEFNADDFEDAE